MDFRALLSQLTTLFSKLTTTQKTIVASSVVAIVAFLVFLVVYTAQPKRDDGYVVLFDNLNPNDTAAVIKQLEKDDIPYKIPNDNVVEVPKDYVYKERINIAALGIPKNSGVGFELFDTQEFGATSFDQSIKYLRALEGELTRTINALAPIKSASVSLAIPKESLFVEESIKPTASVMIELEENRVLSSKQVRGIKNLVSSAVPSLLTENVSLINSDGETLGSDDEFSMLSELSVMQQKFKSREESKKEKKIVNVLAPFLGGKNRVVAKVTIEYDFSQSSSTSEVYDPENVVRSEQTLDEKREGFAPKEVGGVPGTVSNIGPVQGLESQQTKDKYEKSTTTSNYEISKKVTTTKGEFAKIKKISAAVVVDGKYKNKVDANGDSLDELEYVQLDATQIEAITSLVKQSIGVSKDRGDQVSVRNFQFETLSSNVVKLSNMEKFTKDYIKPFSPILKYIFVFIILFILYKKIISPFSERMLEFSKEDDGVEKPILDLDEDDEEDLVEKVSAMRKKVEEQLGIGENFNEDELKHEVLLEKIRSFADEKNEEFAAILQALLDEEQGELHQKSSNERG